MTNEEKWIMLSAENAKHQTKKLLARNIAPFAPVLKDIPMLAAMFAEPIADTQIQAKQNDANQTLLAQISDARLEFNLTESMKPDKDGNVCTFTLHDKTKDLIITGGSNGLDKLNVSISQLGDSSNKQIELTVKIPT